jgi:hypothetical protein
MLLKGLQHKPDMELQQRSKDFSENAVYFKKLSNCMWCGLSAESVKPMASI